MNDKKSLILPTLFVGMTTVFAQEKPNVILILADDMGIECLSTYGSAYNTPNLDKLAEKGMKFNYCYSQPLSSPSRVELMTGKYNHRNYTQWGNLTPDNKTLGNLAKQGNYTTCVAGKWQLGKDSQRPHAFGFDEYCLWQLNGQGNRYCKPLIETQNGVINTSEDDYGPDICSNFVLNFIENNAKNKQPFFVYYPMMLIHSPLLPTPNTPEWTTVNRRFKENRKYHQYMVEYTDQLVGKIISKIEELNLSKNTLILFTGDNGTMGKIEVPMKDGTFIRGGKGKTNDRGIHVPLIAYWDKVIKPGKISKDLIDFSDFYPTLAEIFQVNISNEKDIDGIGFASVLKGKSGRDKQFCYSYYHSLLRPNSETTPKRYSFNDQYKLYDDGRLYNTVKDVLEQYPITTPDSKEQEIKKQLQLVLDKYNTGVAVEQKIKNTDNQKKKKGKSGKQNKKRDQLDF